MPSSPASPAPDRSHLFIESIDNPSIKYIRSLLQRRKTRYEERAFVVEGFRAVGEALDANVPLGLVLVRDDIAPDRIDPRLRQYRFRETTDTVFRVASDVEMPQGILVVATLPPERPLYELIRDQEAAFLVVADGIRDPGNMGTLLRSAAGAGADAVIIAEQSVDPYNPKVVRAAMGAHFHVSIVHRAAAELEADLATISQVVVADEAGDHEYDQIDLTQSTALVVGGEAYGPLGTLRHSRIVAARIPLARGVESLNAGVAGSLLLFEAARQRRHR